MKTEADKTKKAGKTDKTSPSIVIRDLHKSFGKQKVLDGIDLEVAQGETLAVLGRSGTGKSVLLKLIVGLQTPDSGSICIHGQEINGLATDKLNELRKKIGFVFQFAALYDSLSVQDNVAFPLQRHTKMSATEQKKKAKELLASVGMEKDLLKLPAEISGGMQKRVSLARALALDPDVILFDEPTSGLDPITAGEIEELILKLQKERNTASIVVTHDVRGARAISDRMAFLRDGKVLAEGTFAALKKSGEEFVAQFLETGS